MKLNTKKLIENGNGQADLGRYIVQTVNPPKDAHPQMDALIVVCHDTIKGENVFIHPEYQKA